MEGYRTGEFPDGSILAGGLHEINEGPTGGHFTPEGPLRGVGVMVRTTSDIGLPADGGYESFNPGNEAVGALSAAEKTQCYACHVSRKDHGFVFTKFAESPLGTHTSPQPSYGSACEKPSGPGHPETGASSPSGARCSVIPGATPLCKSAVGSLAA